jgi:hypothetical protein
VMCHPRVLLLKLALARSVGSADLVAG